MKNIILLLLLVPFLSIAQNRKDKLKSLKIAYITSELNLTQEETAKFIPIFSDYDNKQQELRKKLRVILEKRKSVEEMTDTEAQEMLVSSEKIEEEVFVNRKNLVSSLKNILSAKKILKLRKIELEFNKKLIDKIKDRE